MSRPAPSSCQLNYFQHRNAVAYGRPSIRRQKQTTASPVSYQTPPAPQHFTFGALSDRAESLDLSDPHRLMTATAERNKQMAAFIFGVEKGPDKDNK